VQPIPDINSKERVRARVARLLSKE